MNTHPAWLKRSKIPLTIVCGPPCSGKTTYVRKHAVPGDTIIDLDNIRRGIDPTFKPWLKQNEKLLNRAMRVRNMMLAQLALGPKNASVPYQSSAWFVVGAPSQAEREWWKTKLGGTILLLNPGIEECKRRAYARGTPLAAAGVATWEAKSCMRWSPPIERKRIGPDGYFLDDDVDEADVVLARELRP